MTSITVERRPAIDALAVAVMIGLTFSWGLNGVAAKIATGGFSPVMLTVLRSAIAGVLVFAWCRWQRVPLFSRDGTLWPGILAGVLFGLEFLLIFFSLEHTSVGRSTLMVNTMPFWVLIGAHLLLGERMSARRFAGLALAFGGVALVFSDKLTAPSPTALLGDLLSLGAGILWAATSIVIRKTRLAQTGAEKMLLYQLVVATVMALPLIPLGGPPLREVTPVVLAALAFQSVFVVAITYAVWFWMLRRYPVSGLSSFAFLTPAFGVLCGAMILGEPLSWRILAALLLIGVGLVIVNRPSRS